MEITLTENQIIFLTALEYKINEIVTPNIIKKIEEKYNYIIYKKGTSTFNIKRFIVKSEFSNVLTINYNKLEQDYHEYYYLEIDKILNKVIGNI